MPSTVVSAFQTQAEWCGRLDAPFTAYLLRLVALELDSASMVGCEPWETIRCWIGDPVADALPLRVAGALHGCVLRGDAPVLFALYPPRTDLDGEKLRAVLLHTMRTHAADIVQGIASPPQTNEVGRSAVLLGGFLEIASRVKKPLRLLEIGASAGLNLLWDKFRYRLGEREWGDRTSSVVLAPDWQGMPPRLDAEVAIAERSGCDLSPPDVCEPADRLRLLSYVWPEKQARLDRLRSALDLAARVGIRIDRADAAEWIAAKLETDIPGRATILFHSIMWPYLSASSRAGIQQSIRSAALRATTLAPFAWLRFEQECPDRQPDLRLTLWPGGEEEILATAHPHGESVRWRP